MESQARNRLIINSAMGGGRRDYEAVSSFSPEFHLVELHNHDFYEIFIHIRGGKNVYINGQAYSLVPGSLMIYPPFQLHGFINYDTLYDYERAFLYITPEQLRILGCGLMPFEQILSEKTGGGCYQYYLDEEMRAECVRLLQKVSSNPEPTNPAKRLEDYSYMIQFLLRICRTVTEQDHVSQPLPINSLIREVIRYLDQNFTARITLEDLAEHFSVSKSYLCHKFIRTINSSVYQYVLFRRVTYAKELLAEGVQPMDAAYQCGFGNYSNFLRSFSKLAGCSPREYIKRLRP